MSRRHRFSSTVELLESRIAPAAVVSLRGLTGQNGFKINGLAAGDSSGSSVSAAGDVNADGFPDFIVSSPFASPHGAQSGATYVIFGKAGGFTTPLELTTLDGTNGFKILGEAAGDLSGLSVSAAGDVNGDFFGDIIIGAPADNTGAGAAYVVFGKATPFAASLDLSTLDGTNGFKILGETVGDRAGHSVGGNFDYNRDGLSDVIIGADLADPNGPDSGAIYVVFGSTSPFSATLDLSTLNGGNGFKIQGEAPGDNAGQSVAGGGDINGDTYGDLIIGAPAGSPPTPHAGTAYVVFGGPSGSIPTLNLSTIDNSKGIKIFGAGMSDSLGASVSPAGDFNHDGILDILIGAPGATPHGANSGAAYVVFGRTDLIISPISVANLDGINGVKIYGETADDFLGISISGGSDVNADGISDLLIGAGFGGTPNGGQSGKAYVVFGRLGSPANPFDLSTLTGANGFRIDGANAGDHAGTSVSLAGDINGDGIGDLLIGAFDADPNGLGSGASSLLFGVNSLVTITAKGKTATYLDPTAGVVTVKVSKGIVTSADFHFNEDGSLRLLDLTSHALLLKGANLTITSKPLPTTSLVHFAAANVGIPFIGDIDATGIDLGNVTVKGDLSHLTVGTGLPAKPAIKVFKVASLGLGQGMFPDLTPGLDIAGAVIRVMVTGAVNGMDVHVAKGLGQLVVGGPVGSSHFDIGEKMSLVKFSAGATSSTFQVPSLGSLTIVGDLIADAFHVGTVLKTIKITGNVVATDITAGGTAQPKTAGKAAAFGTIKITGDLELSRLLAGYDLTGTAKNADVTIGAITIGGRFKESSIVAGALPDADGHYGTGDTLIAGGNPVIAKIASLTIKGTVLGTAADDTDSFGIVAEEIGKIKVGTAFLPLTKGPGNDPSTPFGGTTDVSFHEVAA